MYAFNFHGIGMPGPEIAAEEKPYWVTEEMFVAYAELFGRHRDRVIITFDDGNRSDLEIAAPVLLQQDLTARIFVLTGCFGSAGYLQPEDLRTLRDMGFVIGSHGIDHIDWAAADTRLLAQEVAESKRQIEDALGASVFEAAVPFGSYSRRVLEALRRAGYGTVWTSDGAATRTEGFLRPRLSIRSDTPFAYVAQILAEGVPLRRRLRQHMSIARKRLI